ncbi:phosphoenolpyruvate--protein phosphotransferase [Mycoplasmoides pirum]|uniref:phosphoenolpyruvate--protein phosphotransferase n=1 Tax=Mycoplasmoides pirum TaxID=2122 RepID=UPI0004869A31|nr:phosphoenolpyruvate--protein phosphotransferase [Mycoplasmoides pirum]
MSKTFNGVPASDGFVVANVYKLVTPTFDIPEENIRSRDVSKHETALEDALLEAKNQLENIKENTQAKMGSKYAAIFQAHIDILNDPTLIDDLYNSIRVDLNNVIYAVNTVFDKTYEKFASMDDSYFRERSADIADLKTRLLCILSGEQMPDLVGIDKSVIIVADDLSPSQTSMLDKKFVKGFITNVGGPTSHSAIMARNLEIPAILGLKNITEVLKDNEVIAIDGNKGIVYAELKDSEIEKFKNDEIAYSVDSSIDEYATKKAVTTDNFEVLLAANIGNLEDMSKASKHGATGVGLFRTEFLYMNSNDWPTEEEQFKVYKEVVEKANNELVIIRTLDIGGDKSLPYHKFEKEMNPFLGNRAIRFCLAQPNILKTQLRAILRASNFGKVGIMFPMITTLDELKKVKDFLSYCEMELKIENTQTGKPMVGIMIETPAAAMVSDILAKNCDFFSIGTNDLIQYTFAVDRMSKTINYLYQPLNPALLRLIKKTVEGSNNEGIWTGVCGEMASYSAAIPLLIGLGVKELSMAPSAITKAKKIICALNKEECVKLANSALNCETEKQVEKLVHDFLASYQIQA